jgi:hypothetical protein
MSSFKTITLVDEEQGELHNILASKAPSVPLSDQSSRFRAQIFSKINFNARDDDYYIQETNVLSIIKNCSVISFNQFILEPLKPEL